MKNYYHYARRYPPILCRLLARKGGRAMKTSEISIKSGLSAWAIEGLADRTTWDGIALDVIESFTKACGVDFTNRNDMNRAECYLRTQKVSLKYLTKDPLWKTYYLPLILKWSRADAISSTLPRAIKRLLDSLKQSL